MTDTENTKYVTRKTFFAAMLMLAAFCLLCSASVVLGSFDTSDVTEPYQLDAAEQDAVAADAYGVMFILRNIEGRVAVLNSLETSILEILDISVSVLPEEARTELEGGVLISSVSELVSVVEGYKVFT